MVSPRFLVVLPTDFAIEPTSSFGLDLTLERTSWPPAPAAAAAPTASAGPFAAPAALPAFALSESPELFALGRLRLLKETKSHATSVERRIKQLGGTAETVHVPGPEGMTKAAKSVQEMVGKAKAAARGPLDRMRGTGEQETMLNNARAEYQEEAEVIATYTVIDAMATSVGDKQTSKLARDIRRDEERMALYLADLLPELAVNVPTTPSRSPRSRATLRAAQPGTSRGASSARPKRAKGAKKGS